MNIHNCLPKPLHVYPLTGIKHGTQIFFLKNGQVQGVPEVGSCWISEDPTMVLFPRQNKSVHKTGGWVGGIIMGEGPLREDLTTTKYIYIFKL